MISISDEDLKRITDAVQESVKTEVSQFYIERETHYNHHQFLTKMIGTLDSIEGVIAKTITAFLVIGLLGLISIGFWVKFK